MPLTDSSLNKTRNVSLWNRDFQVIQIAFRREGFNGPDLFGVSRLMASSAEEFGTMGPVLG